MDRLRDLHHRSRSCGWEFTPRLLKVVDYFLNDFPKLLVDFDRVVAVNSSDQIGALANVNLVFVVPLDPSILFVDWFHFSTFSMAGLICFS